MILTRESRGKMFWEAVRLVGKEKGKKKKKGSDLGGQREIFGACLSREDQPTLVISLIDLKLSLGSSRRLEKNPVVQKKRKVVMLWKERPGNLPLVRDFDPRQRGDAKILAGNLAPCTVA